MLSKTKQELREGVRERANLLGTDNFLTDTALDKYVSDAISSLISKTYKLPEARNLLGKRTTLSGTGPSLTLPEDFWQMYMLINPGVQYSFVERLQFHEFPFVKDVTTSLSYTLVYLPRFDRTAFSSDGDSFEYVGDWNIYVECKVAEQLVNERYEDSRALAMQKEEALADVVMCARNLDRTGVSYVQPNRRVRAGHGRMLSANLVNRRYDIEGTQTGRTLRIVELGVGVV